MRVAISGASGMIGSELVPQLREAGHDVVSLVRHPARSADESQWDPAAASVDQALIDSVDAVVNLSGASLGKIPWSASYKKTIVESRVQSTRTLAEAVGRSATPPEVFLSASAVGIYGDRPAERLTDESKHGEGFLADVTEKWELASLTFSEGTRRVNLRTGIVVGDGGALAPLMLVTRLGAGAKIGTGGQHWPWISLYDEAAAIRHLLTSTVSGPVNLAGPTPATSARMTRYLAERMHRPHLFALPESLISLAMGEAGRQMLLTSQMVLPTKLLEDGFVFRDETVESAIDALLDSKA